MTFVKGQSGNPGGKPKTRWTNKRTITELARDMCPEALETLGKIMRDTKSTSTARAIAADRILDRGYGKVPQAIGVVAQVTARKASDLTDDELAQIVAGTATHAVASNDDGKLIEAVAIEEEEGAADPVLTGMSPPK